MTNGRHEPLSPRNGRRASRPRILGAIRKRSRWVLLAAGAVGLCAIVTGASLAALSSSSGQTGHVAGTGSGISPTAATQTPGPVAFSTTRPDVANAGIAKTALRYPPAIKGQILNWAAGRGGDAWWAVTTQLGNVTQTAGARLYSQLRLDCASLASSAQAALDTPPIPDEAMQRMYAKVLTAVSATAADCRNAISLRPEGDEAQRINLNKALLNRSLARFGTESRELYTATAEIRTLHR
jgi:hypothetical protein